MFERHDTRGFSYRELSVLDALSIPDLAPDDATENEKTRALNARIGFVLSASLVSADSGERLFPTAEAALAGIPARQWGDALEVFADVMRVSGMWKDAEATDEKNA